MTIYLGTFALGTKPEESALGIYDDVCGGWWVKCWREDYGPFSTVEQAQEILTRIAGPYPVLKTTWRELLKLAACKLALAMGVVAFWALVVTLLVRW